MKSIRTKLLVAFILVALIPLIAIGFYGLYSITKALRSTSISKIESKVTLLSSKMDDFLKNVSSDLFYLRDSASLRNLVAAMDSKDAFAIEQAKKELEKDFFAFSDQKKIYHQVRFMDVNGQETVRVNRVRGASQVVPKARLQNKKKRYYFADTADLPNGELMISPLDLNREHGQVEKPMRPVIRYGTPIYGKNNSFQGIVLFNVLADKFLDIIDDAADEDETLVFISKTGSYYTHPDIRKEWGGKGDLNTGEGFSKDYADVATTIVGAVNPDALSAGNDLVAFAPVVLEKDHYLGQVIDIVPNSVVFKSVAAFRNIFIVIGAFVLLITIIISILLSGSITKPLIYLTKTTDDMSKGNIEVPITIDTKDEISVLAASIERLRKSMKIFMTMKKKK